MYNKRDFFAILCVSLLTSLSIADLSQPVGYYRLVIEAQQSRMVALPFENQDSSLDAMLQDQLTGASDPLLADRIAKWDTGTAAYITALKADGTGDPQLDGHWFVDFVGYTPSALTMAPGSGITIENRQSFNQVVYLGGLVPQQDQWQISLQPGVHTLGFPFTAAIPLENSVLEQEQLNGDILTHPADPNPVDMLLNGQGYWYERNVGSVLTWTPQRPYQALTLPDPLVIRIAAIQARDTGVELTIECTGADGETLDIYYQDIPQQGAVDLLQGWSLAKTALPTMGQTQINWTDLGDENRLPPAQTRMRVYIVGRQDVDADQNGLPDIREMLLTPEKLLESSGTPILLQRDFATGTLDGWNVVNGQWKITEGELEQEWNAYRALIYWDQTDAFAWEDYVFEADMRSTDDDAIGVAFYFQDPDNYYCFYISKEDNLCWLELVHDGVIHKLASAPASYEVDQVYRLSVNTLFNSFEVSLDGVSMFSAPISDSTIRSGTIGFFNTSCSDAFYNHVMVRLSEKPNDTQPPSTPNNVKASACSSTLVALCWEESVDNLGGIEAYEVFRDNQSLGTTRQTYWIDQNATPDTLHMYHVRAIDMLTNHSALSLPAEVTTPNGQQLLAECFHEAIPAEWVAINGTWRVAGGLLEQGANTSHALLYYHHPMALTWNNTLHSVLAKSTDDDGLGLAFYVRDDANYYRFSISRQLNYYRLERIANGVRTTIAETEGSYEVGRWYLIQAQVIQGQITILINGEKVMDGIQDYELPQGSMGLYTHQCDDAYYALAAVTAPDLPPDTVAPSVPLQLESALVSFSQIYLQWERATDNVAVAGYEISRNGVPVASVTQPQYTDNYLQPETTYSYTVKARDLAGNLSEASTPVQMTTTQAGEILMNEDFDDGVMEPWQVSRGNWSIMDGEAVQSGNEYKSFLYYAPPEAMSWSNYTVSCNLRSVDKDVLGVAFCFQDRDNLYRFVMDRDNNSRRIEKMIHNSEMPNKLFCVAEVEGGYEIGRNYLLQISIHDGLITVRLDGEDVFKRIVEDHTWSNGTVSLYANICDGAFFDNVCVYKDGGMIDSDGDGIPDAWEVQQGLDPYMASDQDDLDGDGLVNIDEYRNGTDINLADTDGDGMNDAWEVEHGLNPLDHRDQGGDQDLDELTNLEEYTYGSDPMSEDQDNDGIPDLLECLGTMTSPSESNQVDFIDVLSMTGAHVFETVGQWTIQNEEIIGQHIRGHVSWQVQVDTPDVYRLVIAGHETIPRIDAEFTAPLRVTIDDAYIIRRAMKLYRQEPGSTFCFTPWLSQGTHTITVEWDNYQLYSKLALSSITLQELAGNDANQDGVKDWVENWLANRNTLSAPEASLVSPVFIEGFASYPDLVQFNQAWSAQKGLKDRWYADIPLQPGQPTLVEARFENQGIVRTVQIDWQPLDVMTADSLTIRKGDTLLLTADGEGAPSDPVHIGITGGVTLDTTTDAPVPHTFTQAGVYTVSAYVNDQSRSIQVNVLDASLDSPVFWAGTFRDVDFSTLPAETVLQLDNRIWMAPEWQQPEEQGCLSFMLGAPEHRGAVVRLDEEGPVLCRTDLRGMNLFSSAQVYLRAIERYEDGTELVEMGLVASPLPDDVAIEMRIYIGGLVFEDGTVIKNLLPADFDETGFTSVRFLYSPETQFCHKLSLFQNATLIGIR